MKYYPQADFYFDKKKQILIIQKLIPDPAFGGYIESDNAIKFSIAALNNHNGPTSAFLEDIEKNRINQGSTKPDRKSLTKMPAVSISYTDEGTIQVLPLKRGKRGQYAEIEEALFCKKDVPVVEFLNLIRSTIA